MKKKHKMEKQVLTIINDFPIYRNFVENLPFNPDLIPLTREKRKAGVLSEVLFWKQVRNRNFHRIDFDRQRIIGNYIVDFYVKTLGLVVDIYGSKRENNIKYNQEIFQQLEDLGLQIFLVHEDDIKTKINTVMTDLEQFVIQHYS